MTSLLHLLITCHVIHVVIATKTLYIGGLFDLGKVDSWRVIPAAQIAVEEINNSSFLPGYRLELLVNDTRSDNFKIASGVHNYLNNGPKKIMLLGPVDNDVAKSVAYYAALPQYGLLQFSYGTDDLNLAKDRHLYPYFFRTPISLATLDDLRISFIKNFPHWTEVGIIHGDNFFDTQLSDQLKSDLQSKGITVLAEVRLEENDPSRAIRTIQEKDIHIVFGLFSVGLAARKMFCQAYKNGLYGPHYVWILQMADNNGWWNPRSGEDIGGCKDIEMTCQIQNYFNVKPEHDFDTKTDYSLSNKSTSHLVSEYYSRVDNGNNTSNRTTKAWLIYDAVWSIAHVLNNSRSKLSKPLENITYGDTQASIVFYNETLKLDFTSPNMKKVRYLSNGNRKFDMNIDQIVIKEENSNPSTKNAGRYDFVSGKFKEDNIKWRAGTPYRKTTNTYITRYIHRALFGALIFLACLGLLYALICLIVVLVYRKQPVIWNSSPIMNTIIIVGCILNYITVILYAFDWTTTTRVTSLCRARAWTFAIGFTLSVGGLVAKLWIAYCVLSERFVRQWRNMLFWMLAIVSVLFILDVIIMGCWEGIDPLYAKMVVYKDQEIYKCFEPITEKTFQANWYTVEHCVCEHPVLWLLLVLVLKALVVLFGVFLAWQTRKLYIKSLNDTQHCGFCLFVVVFCAVLGVLCALLTTKLPNLFFGIVGTLLFLCTTIILALLYIHKISRIVYKLKPRRAKTILVGGKDDPQSTKSTKSTSCSFCTCSAACCITMFSCFPCCNPYTCCRKCCCGTQVHPSKDDDKTEFYINGQAQDREGQIAYLLRELHERDAELARLRPTNTSTSMWTQTYDDDLDGEDDDDDNEDNDDLDGDTGNSDSGSSANSRRSRRKKRNSVKIFNKGADYSHVRSRVDTGVAKSPAKAQKKHDEKYYLGVWQAKGGQTTDAEIAKLRSQLTQKDKEIERLKKEQGHKVPDTKITIINEEADTPNTKEKQCQTDDTVYKKTSVAGVKSPSTSTKSTTPKPTSKNTKPSKNEPKDKVIIIKTKEDKEIKKEEEEPVQSNAEWLFGKPHEEETKPKEKDDDKGNKNADDVSHDRQEQTNIIIIPPENDERKEKQHEKDNKPDDSSINVVIAPTQILKDEEKVKKAEKIENQNKDNEKEKQSQEKEEESRKQEKLGDEKEKEKQNQEKRKSRFSFFGKKDSSPVEPVKENQPINGNSKSDKDEPEIPKEKPVNPDAPPESDKPDKPDSPQVEKQDQSKPDKPDKPESPKVEKRDQPKPDKPDKPESPEVEKHDQPKPDKPDKPESPQVEKQDQPKSDKPDKPESPQVEKRVQPKPDKPDKPESPQVEKQDQPVQPESLTNKPDNPVKLDSKKNQNAKEHEKPDLSKPDEQVKPDKAKPSEAKTKKQDEFDEEESHPIRPPQNTPASVGRPTEATDDKKDEKPEKQEQEPDEDSDDEPSDEMDDVNEEGDDDDDDDKGNDDDDDNDEDKGEDNKDKQKSKRRKKRVGGKLNWNAESKVDTSSGYKRRPTKKIKTYKVDYSHVKSKLSGSPSSNNNENKDENKDNEKRKPRRRVRKKRWNPNEKNQ